MIFFLGERAGIDSVVHLLSFRYDFGPPQRSSGRRRVSPAPFGFRFPRCYLLDSGEAGRCFHRPVIGSEMSLLGISKSKGCDSFLFLSSSGHAVGPQV